MPHTTVRIAAAIVLGTAAPALAQEEIVVWVEGEPGEAVVYEEIAETYNAANPDTRFVIVKQSSNLFNPALVPALSAGEGPDLFTFGTGPGQPAAVIAGGARLEAVVAALAEAGYATPIGLGGADAWPISHWQSMLFGRYASPDGVDEVMFGADITAFTGRMEYLFGAGIPSIGIVDGGNEIGIGSVATAVRALPGLPDRPCIIFTDRIVLGTVANWGTYGVLAALTRRSGTRVLPTIAEEADLRTAVVAAGAIDGDSGEAIPAVDGYPSELNALVVARLHDWLDAA